MGSASDVIAGSDVVSADGVPPLRGAGWADALADVEPLRQRIWRAAIQDAGPHLNPSAHHVFAAFDVPFADVRVVIIGQDPYPDARHATGRAFAVPLGTSPLPASLRNILKELSRDIADHSTQGNGAAGVADAVGVVTAHRCDVHPDLSDWAAQGVLLLNRVLTCRTGASLSHEALGWQKFTEASIRALTTRNQPLVGILWGRNAQGLQTLFGGYPVVTAAHPSPLSAHRGFFGSGSFTRCNQLLNEQGHPGIRWCSSADTATGT